MAQSRFLGGRQGIYHNMKALTQVSKKYFKYSDTAVLLNPDGLITSQTGGGGWTIYRFREYGELWLMLNAQADVSYPRWQTDRPNVFATFKTPKKCIITSYSTTQWCDGNNRGRICNHWQIKGYESYDDLLHLRNGVIIDDNTWPSINKGESKTVDLSTNTKGFQYYSVQMISNFTGSSYCSMGSTKFYAREAAEVSGDDYDYYEETKTYKFVNQKFNGQNVFYTPASLGKDKIFSSKLAELQTVGDVHIIGDYATNFSRNDFFTFSKAFNFVYDFEINFDIIFQDGNSIYDLLSSEHLVIELAPNGIITYEIDGTQYTGGFLSQGYTNCNFKYKNGVFTSKIGNTQFSHTLDINWPNQILTFGCENLAWLNLKTFYIKELGNFAFRGDMIYGVKNFGILSNNYIIEKGPIDYTVVGNPTIENGILSNTSTDDYIKISNFPMRSKNNWQLDIKAATVFNNSQQRAVYFPSGYLRVIGTTPAWNLYIDGQEFGLGEIHLYPYARVVRENNTIYAYDSTNGIDYNLRGTITNANLSDGDLTLGGGSGQPWAGTIDLNFTSIKLNGWAWFGSANLIWASDNIYLRAPFRFSASEGKGTPYIDSGIIVNDNSYGVNITYRAYNSPFEGLVMTNGFDMYRFQYDRLRIGSTQNVSSTLQNLKRTIVKYNIGDCYNDGKVYFIYPEDETGNNEVTTSGFSGTITKSTLIGSTWNYQTGIDYFALQFSKNNQIIRSFVPVPQGLKIGNFTVPSNGMYDMVEQKFYPNAGTGEFIYGKD